MNNYDFRGLKCPIPVLKAFKIIKENKNKNSFSFLTDDPSAPKDFNDFCNNTGYELVDIKKNKKHIEIKIKKINSEK